MKPFSLRAAFLASLLVITYAAADERKVLYWYDPMVPDQHFDKPGKSPFMNMQLVPKYAEPDATKSDTTPAVTVSHTMQQQLGVRHATVQREDMQISVRASGQLVLDETRMVDVAVRTDAYVEQLLVRAVGEHVERGQKIANIYSSSLQQAQVEYLLAINHASSTTPLNSRYPEARVRLLKLGMTEQDIDELTRIHQVLPRVGIYAPIEGLVMTLATREGGSVKAGDTLLQLVDHSKLWQIVNVPERYAQLIRVGQAAEIQLDSNPGTTLAGSVQYIYPELDTSTRSLRVRIALENPDGLLRPGMYGHTTLRATTRTALTVPTEAVIATGTHTVVIVQDGERFRPAEIRTGLEQDDKTEVISGLHAGEQVVTSGQFLIDSEATLSGVLARMNPPETQP